MPGYAMASARATATDPTTAPVANPSDGPGVLMSWFSGPKGSPGDVDSSNNASTGALSTGIGFGVTAGNPLGMLVLYASVPPTSVNGFTDDYAPGLTLPDGTAAVGAILTAIGGGKSGATSIVSRPDGSAATVPYNAQPLVAFGNGGSRDAGTGPVFTGFGMKVVTAVGTVANGAVVETGFTNRSGAGIIPGKSVFGSSTTASPVVA